MYNELGPLNINGIGGPRVLVQTPAVLELQGRRWIWRLKLQYESIAIRLSSIYC